MYDGLTAYYGDIHSHCNIGYAHGSIEDAFHNARLQLDFACVTVHGHWHDMPRGEERLAYLVDYHENGFRRTAEQWEHLRQTVAAQHEDQRFVTFLGFEWHSNTYGDHNIYFNGVEGEVIRASTMEELREGLRAYARQGIQTMLIPHHIGYKAGYRGINWATYDPEFISVVEIMSMHGASESAAAPRPYLHTMGPRDQHSTLQYGLSQGALVGVVGSTDHHSAHPGSYGHGRMGVWASELTRRGIWDAIRARRTYALTGDRMQLQFSLNDTLMGGITAPDASREMFVEVVGGAAIDYIDIVHNNRTVQRVSPLPDTAGDDYARPLKIHVEVGWGERGVETLWDVALQVVDGELIDTEPRFRGHDIVAPEADAPETYAFSDWQRVAADTVAFQSRTWGNPTTTTPAMQGMCLTIQATPATRLNALVNGKQISVPVSDLRKGPVAEYLGGFVSPAIYFHQAAAEAEYHVQSRFTHRAQSSERDWYYVRVRQQNNQWAWSSPIWIEGA